MHKIYINRKKIGHNVKNILQYKFILIEKIRHNSREKHLCLKNT